MVHDDELEPRAVLLQHPGLDARRSVASHPGQGSFYWRCVYSFGKYLSPTTELLSTLQQALILSVSSSLQQLPKEEESTILKQCLKMIATCREVTKELDKKSPGEHSTQTTLLLHQLEFYALVHSHCTTLEAKLRDIAQTTAAPYTFYLDLFYLLQQESCPEHAVMKECLRLALQTLLKEPSFAMTAVLEVIRCMMEVCDTKAEEYHWAEQLVQITKSQGEQPCLSNA